jgi:hypothetical protein
VFNLTLDFPVGFESKSGSFVEAKVKSNHPRFPIIKVSVFQPQRRAVPASIQPDVPGTGEPAPPKTR